jgi:hypothetical protein
MKMMSLLIQIAQLYQGSGWYERRRGVERVKGVFSLFFKEVNLLSIGLPLKAS